MEPKGKKKLLMDTDNSVGIPSGVGVWVERVQGIGAINGNGKKYNKIM